MTLLEEFPTFSLWHDPASTCLYATWTGRHEGTVTRVQYDLIRWHARVTGSIKLLNDSLLDEDGWSQVAGWLAEQGLQRLAQDGIELIAWVLPQQGAAFFDTARVLAQAKQPIINTFSDAQAAYDWLHRWPQRQATLLAASRASMSAAQFRLLSPAAQLERVKQQGRPLLPRWEPEYYVRPYYLFDTLIVEVYYYVHSGEFFQVKTQVKPPAE